MLRAFFLATILASSYGAEVDDFDETITGGQSHSKYEFIFHDNHNLLLTINGDNCFYTHVTDASEYILMLNNRPATEARVSHLIYQHRRARAHFTDLDTVRQTFQDVLADYHCQGKNIYTLDLNSSDFNIIGHHK